MGAEAEVSRVTGHSFATALENLSFDYQKISADKNLSTNLMEYDPDVALLAVHGKLAEDGTVQSICEYLKIPYSGSGILSSAVGMDKIFSKDLFVSNKIPTPKYQWFDLRNNSIDTLKIQVPLPFVVKPSRDGSSMGITLVRKKEEIEPALVKAAEFDHFILVEELVEGAEVTVPVLRGRALASIEIKPKQGFYDYENKYTEGRTEYILPAPLAENLQERINKLALAACRCLRVNCYARVDIMLDQQQQPTVIEVNTLPGFTPTSLFPKSAAYDGINFDELVQILIEDATLDYVGLR